MSSSLSRPQSRDQNSTDTLSIDLDRLLKRLEDGLLSPNSNERLKTSSYERNRVGANVEYARTLLLRLEHASSSIKIQSRKQSTQADLQAKRDLIKRLNQRLLELNQIDSDDSSSDEEEEDDTADAPREFAPAVATSNSIDHDHSTPLQNPEPPTLRSRNPAASSSQPDTASTTALFSGRNPQSTSTTATTETLLTSSRAEQDLLTSSLVSLAKSLKQSSQQFASSLEAEKEVLARAEQGLDKNALGMDAAGRRMGTLRRMTEGQGWWGRIKLYAIVAGLWVAAFLLVFVGPKLRF